MRKEWYNKLNLFDLLERSAAYALELQMNNGAMPAGHNGPYYDPQTPVRNTGHWLITFIKVHEITGEQKYLDAARKAVNYLLSDEARPMGATFWHRKNPEKDFCNGLIGQAWSIEALTVAAKGLEKPELSKLAEEVFLLHPYIEDVGIWRRVAVDGSYLPFDWTFNHQLWFAASGGLLKTNNEINARVVSFLNKLMVTNLVLYRNGLIKHFLLNNKTKTMLPQTIARNIKLLANRYQMIYKAVGYHQFNLYAFALLKLQFPDHPFWKSNKFKRLWRYARSDQYKNLIENNEFGYPYNPPGFEMPFALEVLGQNTPENEKEYWLSKQVKYCIDYNTYLMCKNTEDSDTLAARLYEATRLPNLKVM